MAVTLSVVMAMLLVVSGSGVSAVTVVILVMSSGWSAVALKVMTMRPSSVGERGLSQLAPIVARSNTPVESAKLQSNSSMLPPAVRTASEQPLARTKPLLMSVSVITMLRAEEGPRLSTRIV